MAREPKMDPKLCEKAAEATGSLLRSNSAIRDFGDIMQAHYLKCFWKDKLI